MKSTKYFRSYPSKEVEGEDYVDLGAAILDFYSSLVDLLAKCAPDPLTIQAGKGDSVRARAILRSLISLDDLGHILSLRFTIPNLAQSGPQDGNVSNSNSVLSSKLKQNSKRVSSSYGSSCDSPVGVVTHLIDTTNTFANIAANLSAQQRSKNNTIKSDKEKNNIFKIDKLKTNSIKENGKIDPPKKQRSPCLKRQFGVDQKENSEDSTEEGYETAKEEFESADDKEDKKVEKSEKKSVDEIEEVQKPRFPVYDESVFSLKRKRQPARTRHAGIFSELGGTSSDWWMFVHTTNTFCFIIL